MSLNSPLAGFIIIAAGALISLRPGAPGRLTTRTVVVAAVLFAVALSSLWLEYPAIVGERPIRILLFREAIVIAGITAIWIRVLLGFSLGAVPPAPAPATRVPTRHLAWVSMVIAGVCLIYAPALRLDMVTGSSYLRGLGDRPWRLFLPSDILQLTDGLYRPLGLMVTGLVVRTAPQLMMASSVALHLSSALLIGLVARCLWPTRPVIALVAGLVAGANPRVVATVFDPMDQQYLLYSSLYLLAILMFDLGLRRARWWPIAACSVCLAAAAVTTEFAVTLPVALLCFSLATGSLRRNLRFGVRAWGAQVLLMGCYLAAYTAYMKFAYLPHVHEVAHAERGAVFFPLNFKRIILSLTYLPFWSFLFPYDPFIRDHPWAPGLTWLGPMLALPILWIGATRAWRDRGFCFGVVAAAIAIGPAMNFFDVAWGMPERHGHLAFLWLSLPYAWLLVESTTGPFATRWWKAGAVAAAVAAIVALALVGGSRLRELMRAATSADRIPAAVAQLRGRDPGRTDVLHLDTNGYWEIGNVIKARVAAVTRGTAEFAGNHSEWNIQSEPPAAGGPRRVTIEWHETRLPTAGGSAGPENVFVWEAEAGRYLDVTETLRRKYAATAGGSVRVRPRAEAGSLVSAGANRWIQRFRGGTLGGEIDPRTPEAGDELILRLSIRPLGIVPPDVASEATIEWTDTTRTNRIVFPLTADGSLTEYSLRVGTNVSWLTSDRVGRFSIRLPQYPFVLQLD